MKKIFLFAALLVVLAFTACMMEKEQKTVIAILTPLSHPSLEKIEQGFIETIETAHPGTFQFIVYNAQGNKNLMRSEIEEIVRKKASLVLTIGTNASQMVAEYFNKKNVEIPVVFTCVNDPIGFNIISQDGSFSKNITGVKELLRLDEELAALVKYKPEIKKIMLVYNPLEPGLQKDQKEIEEILKKKEIALSTVEIFQTNELLSKASSFIQEADAVIVLKDNMVVGGLAALVKLCNTYSIPLMASDLDSPDNGAAFGYGIYEINFGIEAAHKAIAILTENRDPATIPVTAPSNFTLKINREAAVKQGIHLPEEIL